MGVCPWLGLSHAGSLSRLLSRLGVSYKRAREHLHSPDPDYLGKLRYVYGLLGEAAGSGGRLVVAFLDELTYYRQPGLSEAFEARGPSQPLAERSHGANTPTRVIGAVDALSGRVTFWQGAKTDVARIVQFYRALREAHPAAERIYAVQDNWPVHFHPDLLCALPDLLCALEGQESPFPFRPAKHWRQRARRRAREQWEA